MREVRRTLSTTFRPNLLATRRPLLATGRIARLALLAVRRTNRRRALLATLPQKRRRRLRRLRQHHFL